MSIKSVTQPARGRPLSLEVERAVFAEAMRLVAVDNASSVTRRAIAQGAGVSRQTLYNRWETTADIVLDALIDRAATSVGAHPHAGLRGYLTDLADAVDGWARPGLRTIVGLAQLDRDFAARFRTRFFDTRHAALTSAIQNAASFDRSTNPEAIAELIAGSLWFRVLIADQPLDDDWIDQMVDLVAQ